MNTPRLGLPEIAAAQAQKHVTVNEALGLLDTLTATAIKGLYVNTPPGSPVDGDVWYTGAAPTGAWAGYPYKLAYRRDGAWRFATPVVGQFMFNEADGVVYVRTSGGERPVFSGGAPGLRNMLINGDLGINQRGFAGGALAAGQYGYDRWRSAAAGTSVTRDSANLVTLSGGSIEQVLEAPQIAGEMIFVSVESPSGPITAAAYGTGGSVQATIPAGAGRRGVMLAVPAVLTGNVIINLGSAPAVTFKNVQAERGPVGTAYDRRPVGLELELCRRYCRRAGGGVVGKWYAADRCQLSVPYEGLRASPTMSLAITSVIVADPGVANSVANPVTLQPNSIGPKGATINLIGFSGAVTGNIALAVTDDYLLLNAEL